MDKWGGSTFKARRELSKGRDKEHVFVRGMRGNEPGAWKSQETGVRRQAAPGDKRP